MSNGSSGRDLFIVDNSVSGWTALRYLEEWTGIAKAFDIATGFFEVGSLLALDGKWQELEKIRILMGAETTHRTRQALREAVEARAAQELDRSLEADKRANPFLDGVPAIVEAMRTGQIECRVYDRDKFHAKAYITHAKLEVVGSQALVGSSNFTAPGLTTNIELNVQIQSAREVAQLQEWYEEHWQAANDVTDSVLEIIRRHTQPFTPFEVYAKALQEFFRGHELTASEWDKVRSRMYPRLDEYQKEAYQALLKIAHQHGGAFLCDGVGLGKTYVGLMLIERLVVHEGKRVVLLAPKGAKEGVWEPHLRRLLPDVGGVGGAADFSNLAVFSHTDLSRTGDFPERFRRIAELADAVVIDEAHHFRNPGSQGDPAAGMERSRYFRLYDLLDGAHRPKSLFMLTATPINNRLSDFRHMMELFTRRDEAYFARTLGVNHLRTHFNNLEKALRALVGGDGDSASENLMEAQQVLAKDELFQKLVIQRSRRYARASQLRETGDAAAFPERLPPRVAEYSIRKTYGRLLDLLEKAFARAKPLFALAIYYPLAWYQGDDQSIDPFEENRQKQVVGLIRTQFLKRFESSVRAFELSCDRLLKKLLAFVEVHSISDSEKRLLDRWRDQNADVLGYIAQRQLQLWGEGEPEDPDEDFIPQEMLDDVKHLDRSEYDVASMIQETFLDLDQIVKFLDESRQFEPRSDDKLQKLIRLLKSNELAGQKVLIFTEFADTARYLRRELAAAGIDGLEQVDSTSKGNRAEVIRRFSPYYNGTTTAELAERGETETRILISTDILSEGLNLQDACRLINYDIHWNPVRLMQRIGRVDRRLDPAIEAGMLAEHPERAATRGEIAFWNFLPPGELEALLALYQTVSGKTLLISKTFGIEGRKLLTPEDDYDALKEFSHQYEGPKSVIEDMHLEYQALLKQTPGLEARLRRLPGAFFSGRRRPGAGTVGVFFCYALPALDKEQGEFTEEAGATGWYLYDLNRDLILDEPHEILASIRSTVDTPRHCATAPRTLIDIRDRVEKHIKNTYLKRVDAPVGANPALKCWMELNEG